MNQTHRLPPWLRTTDILSPSARAVKRLLRQLLLHTVCEEARCPNIGECFSRRTATFMILGGVCTRACAFCGVRRGQPRAPEPLEPERVARAVSSLGLGHCVITSVTRDDLPDGGASLFRRTVQAVRVANPETTVEVLAPDFGGDFSALESLLGASPDVFNHNVETVPRLYRRIRPGADYERSLKVLAMAKRFAPSAVTKSGLMIGLGESLVEVEAVLADLAQAGVDAVTIGQYMRPSLANVEVCVYWEPEVFDDLAARAKALGIPYVVAGPLVRSSYRAGELLRRIKQNATALRA